MHDGRRREPCLPCEGRRFREGLALLAVVVVLGLAFHAYTFHIKENDIVNKYTMSNSWCPLRKHSGSDSTLIADGETDTFTLSGHDRRHRFAMMAKIILTVSYEETSGQVADPCDEVQAQIPPNGMVADYSTPTTSSPMPTTMRP